MKKIYLKRDLQIFLSKKIFLAIFFFFSFKLISAQISVAPLSCYPQFGTAAAMDGAAATSNGTTPFATWKGAYDYAIANGILTIDFVQGTYSTSVSGQRSDWGDADGGFVLPAGMTVNGNGAVIDNSPVGSSQICFATLGSNSTINGFVFKQLSGNPNGGALFIPSSADNWTINDCGFFNCNQGTDAVIVNMGVTATGNITNCDFYGNSNPSATYPQSPGLPSSSALDISGSLTSDLNITNTTFSCNFRNVSGGAVKIQDDVHVDFDGCTFSKNEANSSRGGAVDIGSSAEVLFNNTSFVENFTTGSGAPYGGALAIQDGASVTITNCNFRLNTAVEDGGAIYMSGGAANTTTVNINTTIFEENSNSGGYDGGALYVQNYTDVDLNNCLFLNNTSGDKGAAIWVDGTSNKDLDILNSTFVNNNAGSGEATIHVNYLNTSTSVLIDNSIICDNNSAEDIESEYITAITTVNDSYWDNDKGTINFTGSNTNPYAPSYDANWNEVSGAGWTGVYTQAATSSSCPSTPTPSSNCVNQGSISGVTFDDSANDDGIDDGTPLAGVLVQLYTCAGVYTGISVTTGATGEFYFGGLENGNCYYLVFTPTFGYNATYQDATGSTSSNDSDMNPGTFQSPQITINTSPNSVDTNDEVNNETHYVTVDAGFTTTTLGLPVELINFSGTARNSIVDLIWNTAIEVNNKGFHIERSKDGLNWENIGFVEGKNNSEIELNYNFKDKKPYSGINYYRLKQVDWNESFEFSNTIIVNTKPKFSQFEIYPNPAHDQINIKINSRTSAKGIISIYDFSGKIIATISQNFSNGKNVQPINISSFKGGIYFVEINLGNEILEMIKFVKY